MRRGLGLSRPADVYTRVAMTSEPSAGRRYQLHATAVVTSPRPKRAQRNTFDVCGSRDRDCCIGRFGGIFEGGGIFEPVPMPAYGKQGWFGRRKLFLSCFWPRQHHTAPLRFSRQQLVSKQLGSKQLDSKRLGSKRLTSQNCSVCLLSVQIPAPIVD